MGHQFNTNNLLCARMSVKTTGSGGYRYWAANGMLISLFDNVFEGCSMFNRMVIFIVHIWGETAGE